MSPFGRARKEAINTRIALFGESEVTLNSKRLGEAIETKLGIGVLYVNRDSPDLNGNRACLNSNAKYIYIANDETEADRLELLAHELGHLKLDPPGTSATIAAIKKISDKHGSLATAKVEAYGARERVELMANMFAREFLLPRTRAYELFIQGHGPRSIAEQLGIPLRIARLQAIDAVLLPELLDQEIKASDYELDDAQVKAAQASERFVNVVAGPGTGKTSTLIGRVRYLIEEMKVDPSHILVLTFTNKAAWELVERLHASGLKGSADVWTGTFHAFGLEFLRKYHTAFALDHDFQVSDTLASIVGLVNHLPKIKLQHYLRIHDPYQWLARVYSAITRLKEQLVTPEEYLAQVNALGEPDAELRREREDVAAVYAEHQRVLKNSGTVDFVDLVSVPTRAMQDDRARYGELASRFQYILVDEYQDVTEAMRQMVKILAKRAKSLWVVGDIRQAIHHWRGASIRSLMVFKAHFEEDVEASDEIRQYPLDVNYRSSAEIVKLVNTCGKEHALQTRFPLSPTSSHRGFCQHIPCLVQHVEGTMPGAVAAAIKKVRENGYRYSDQVVIARVRAELDLIAKILIAGNVPVLHIGELVHWPDVKILLSLMRMLCEKRPQALVGLNEGLSLGLTQANIEHLLAAANSDFSYQRAKWLSRPEDELGPELAAAATTLNTALGGHTRFSTPFEFLVDTVLEQRISLPDVTDKTLDAASRRLALWQFINSVHAGDGDVRQVTLPRFLIKQHLRQRLGETYAEREFPPEVDVIDAVRIMTIHGSKGLEFRAVHLLKTTEWEFGGAEDEHMPWLEITALVPPTLLGSNKADAQFEKQVERQNLLYVGVSRAKDFLYMYAKSGDKLPAPFLSQPPAYRTATFSPAPAAAQQPNEISPPQPGIVLTYEELETYLRCPLQYRYRHELELRSETELDVSIRAQLAIKDIISWVGQHPAQDWKAAFLEAWTKRLLPDSYEDPALWADAQKIVENASKGIFEFGGKAYVQRSVVNNVSISMPDLTILNSSSQRLRVVRLGHSHEIAKAIRPLLHGLPLYGHTIEVFDVLFGNHSKEPLTQSVAVDKTDVYKSLGMFAAGNRSPKPGHACRQCSFRTTCPANPK